MFSVASAFSLALCVLMGGLWVRSYFASDMVTYKSEEIDYSIIVSTGQLHLDRRIWPERIRTVDDRHRLQFNLHRPAHSGQAFRTTFLGRMGFGYLNNFSELNPYPIPLHQLTMPFWFLLILTGVLPLHCCWLMRGRWRREKRRRLGLCEQCGYDMRATPERCPECGASP